MEQREDNSENKRISRKKLEGKLAKAIKRHRSLIESNQQADLELELVEEKKFEQELDAEVIELPSNTEREKVEADLLLNLHYGNIMYLRALNESPVDEVTGGRQALQNVEEFLLKRQRELESGSGNEDTVMMVESDATESKVNTLQADQVTKKSKRKAKKKEMKKPKACSVELSEELTEGRKILKDDVFEPQEADPAVIETITEQENEETNTTEDTHVQPEDLHNEIKRLQEQLSQKDAVIKEQQYQLDKAFKELSDTKPLICDLQNQLLEKDNVIIEVRDQRNKGEGHYKAWIDELNQEMHEKILAFNQVNQKLEEKNVTIDQLNGELDGLKSELQGYKLREQDMKKSLEEAEHFVQTLQTENQEEIEEKNETIDQMNGQLDGLKSELQGYKLHEQDIKKNLLEAHELVERLHTQHQEEMEVKNVTTDRLNEQLDDLKGELERYKLHKHDLEVNLKEAQNVVQRLHSGHQEELEALNAKHVAELESLNLLMSKEQEQRHQELDTLKQYRSEMNNLKESLDKQITRNKDLKQQVTRLTQDWDNSVARLRRKDASLEELKVKINELEASSESEISSLNKEITVRNEEIAALKDKLFELDVELELNGQSAKYEEKFAEEIAQMESQYKQLIQENQQLITKLTSLEKNLSEVTVERKKLLDEVEVFGNTHRMLQETLALLEETTSPVSRDELEHEEPQSMEGMEDLPGASLPQGTKFNKLRELVLQKNNLDLKLSQELQEIKVELEKEKESFRDELNERETRERALEASKQQLETQLTEMEKENGELLRELSLLQLKKKKKPFFRRVFKCLRREDN